MSWQDQALSLAEGRYPAEACGLIIIERGREVFVPCQNRADGNEHFIIAAEDYAAAEDRGEIVGVFHSHPDASPLPSEADLVSCEKTGVPWWIVSVPDRQWHRFEPNGYQAPLVGREFQHGVLDCYAIIRDWYKQFLDIELTDYSRRDNWWHDGVSNLYVENFRQEGFYSVETAQRGDMILMQIASSVPNHAAVYLGDGLILHHLQGRLSSTDVYGGYFQKVTTHILRHERNQTLR